MLVAAGLAWLTCITAFMVAIQISVPLWVRARALLREGNRPIVRHFADHDTQERSVYSVPTSCPRY